MAICPSVATWMGTRCPALFMACWKRKASFSSSSTWRITSVTESTFPQLNPELASFSQLRFEPDTAAHSLRGSASNRQAYARAFVFTHRINPLEHPENPSVLVLSDPDAIILKVKADLRK